MNVLKFLIEKNCKIIFMHTDVELKYTLTKFFYVFNRDDLCVSASLLLS